MRSDVMYTTHWNRLTRAPIADHEWIGADEARIRSSDGELIVAVDAAVIDEEGLPIPQWVLGFHFPGGIRLSFYDQNTSEKSAIDWDLIDGRLWQKVTYSFDYPGEERQWLLNQSLATCRTTIKLDGTGWVSVSTRDSPDQRRAKKVTSRITGRASFGRWIDFPEFGQWDELTTPGPSAYELAGLTTTGKAAQEELASWPTAET